MRPRDFTAAERTKSGQYGQATGPLERGAPLIDSSSNRTTASSVYYICFAPLGSLSSPLASLSVTFRLSLSVVPLVSSLSVPHPLATWPIPTEGEGSLIDTSSNMTTTSSVECYCFFSAPLGLPLGLSLSSRPSRPAPRDVNSSNAVKTLER